MTPCLDCGELVAGRCRPCYLARQRIRNADPKRRGYRDPVYLSQPNYGLCHLCGLPGADTRDHLVPLARNYASVETLPAHRSCNSSRGLMCLAQKSHMALDKEPYGT